MNRSLEKDLAAFWEYYAGDDEWRHFDRGDYYATIYFHGYKNGACGLRVSDMDEFSFPSLEDAKFFGFAVVTLLRIYADQDQP